MHDGRRKLTLSPPLSRKREREQTEFASPIVPNLNAIKHTKRDQA
jgi:hypothetical protein